MTHQGPGRELRASPGKEAAGEVLRRCEAQLEGTVEAEGGTCLCGHKKMKKKRQHLSFIGCFQVTIKLTRAWRDV